MRTTLRHVSDCYLFVIVRNSNLAFVTNQSYN